MLVKFAIDPQALLEEANPHLIYFDRLIEKWENFGILVNASEIDDKIDCIDADIREELEVILKDGEPPLRYRFLEDTVPHVNWETLDDNNIGRLRDWDEYFELAIIEETLAEIIGVGTTGAPLSLGQRQSMCGNVEPIGLAIADQARVWSRASSISRRGFDAGELQETAWSERFSRLALFSTQIVIIDAYALHDRQIDGFIRLLQLIDRDGQSCRVTLFSSPAEDNDETVESIRQRLHEKVGELDGGGVRQVTIRLLPLDEQEHDRRIRFDRSVYAPENSVALAFSGNEGTVPQRIGCALQPADDEYHPYDVMKQTENELIRKAGSLQWLINEPDYMVLLPNSGVS